MTYSVVARCSETGRLGVGVQSHYLAAASIVSWVQADAGAVATQGMGQRVYGAKGLQLMAAGISPTDALAQLLSEDDRPDLRQVALVDSHGALAVHTGDNCIAYADHLIDDSVVFQANTMRNGGASDSMREAWRATEGQALELRLIAALVGGQQAGGDIRGQQAAGIKVADPVEGGRWWEGISIDVRVDDHDDPLSELARLLEMRRAYRIAEDGENAAAAGDVTAGDEAFRIAGSLCPEAEIAFWHGVMLANAGDSTAANVALRSAYAESDDWRELLRRLPSAGLLRASEAEAKDLAQG